MPGAVLVEQGPALVVGVPGKGAVHQRLGEDYDVPRLDRRLPDVMGGALEAEHLFRHGRPQVGLVAARHAGETAVPGVAVGQVPGEYRQAVADRAVGIEAVPVVALVALRRRPAVQPAARGAAAHEHAVVVVDAELRPHQLDQVRNDAGVVDQVAEPRAPPRDMGGAAQAGLVVFPGPGLVGQLVEPGDLPGGQHPPDHQVSLQVELEPLFCRHAGHRSAPFESPQG